MGLWVIKRGDPRVAYLEKKDKRLSTVFDAVGDIVHEDFSDGYSFVVQEIVGQMISGHVAEILCNRLVNLHLRIAMAANFLHSLFAYLRIVINAI